MARLASMDFRHLSLYHAPTSGDYFAGFPMLHGKQVMFTPSEPFFYTLSEANDTVVAVFVAKKDQVALMKLRDALYILVRSFGLPVTHNVPVVPIYATAEGVKVALKIADAATAVRAATEIQTRTSDATVRDGDLEDVHSGTRMWGDIVLTSLTCKASDVRFDFFVYRALVLHPLAGGWECIRRRFKITAIISYWKTRLP